MEVVGVEDGERGAAIAVGGGGARGGLVQEALGVVGVEGGRSGAGIAVGVAPAGGGSAVPGDEAGLVSRAEITAVAHRALELGVRGERENRGATARAVAGGPRGTARAEGAVEIGR